MAAAAEFHRILERANAGDGEAVSRLWSLVHDELRTLARRALGRGAIDLTLQPTMLVNEIFLRLHGGKAPSIFHSRAHFFGAAARALERVLIDHGRARGRIKRGGGQRPMPFLEELLELDGGGGRTRDAGAEIDARDEIGLLTEALGELDRSAPRAAEVVRMKVLGGLENADVAAILDVSARTVGNDWIYGKAFLRRKLRGA